ncbi:uncharacterized protein FOMMEDRAFT_164289 [Fomitiporia mediterranea MF3/22]|uniref:uncharacterized protein n=1 Tax=Fomitiporia mediterranea (strain MF3/22) TaxID=694068 RepID=UPI0004409CE1|nr:uncharacterized protein FOMMEDRAFT_164289 [Fomitiporia mediterranea MF3/22]EJD07267.1 hypothetical protein FOMMEDRAFT_164289 [Fomitiporia mediterranea MF3/22]
MQVTLDARALKPFTRAITCISKYGDEMIIHAGQDGLVLSALNLPKTAYCSFTYRKNFFLRYVVSVSGQSNNAGPSRSNGQVQADGGPGAKWMLQTKALLSILKHRNTDKTAEKCDLIIIDGPQSPDSGIGESADSFESRFIVRLHCKHGIVKTHKLLLNSPMSDEAPLIPSSQEESRILVQAHAIKEIIDHFPGGKSARSDPELVWRFEEDEVKVRSMEKGIDAKGKSQLATELTLGADEFDYYNVPTAPLTLGFFLREFNAIITLADALNTPIDFRFTTSIQPVCISAEADGCNMLFIIATNPARAEDSNQQQARLKRSQTNGSSRSVSGVPSARKRGLEEDTTTNSSARMRTTPRSSIVQQNGNASQRALSTSAPRGSANGDIDFHNGTEADNNALYDPGLEQSQPLFLASQLSAADIEAIRESGLGIEDMDAEEFAAMLDSEGVEVVVEKSAPTALDADNTGDQMEVGSERAKDELDHDDPDEDIGMGPTQLETGASLSSEKTFRPLFED